MPPTHLWLPVFYPLNHRGACKKNKTKPKKTLHIFQNVQICHMDPSRTTTAAAACRLSLNSLSRQKVYLSSDPKDSPAQTSWFWVRRSRDVIKLFLSAVESLQIKWWGFAALKGFLLLCYFCSWYFHSFFLIIIHFLTSKQSGSIVSAPHTPSSTALRCHRWWCAVNRDVGA